MTLTALETQVFALLAILTGWLTSPQFYAQVGAIVIAVAVAHVAARQIQAKTSLFRDMPSAGPLIKLKLWIYRCRDLLFPVLAVLTLAIAVEAVRAAVGTDWLVRLAQSAGVIVVLYAAIQRFITHPLINALCRWVGLPVAALQVFTYLDETTAFLDGIAFEAGNIRLSVYALLKAAVFGGLLFWLGRLSTSAGQRVIRRQNALDVPTRELFAKLFEIALFFVVFILLMQILGLDLTALTVFGGALGVGLGFGLQQIASNFISGIIILLERSLKVGDFIELEDGRTGTLREINMRSSMLSTFDGKDITVPNERFITTRFVNWTHSSPDQRYEMRFRVRHGTDALQVISLIETAVARHPLVLQLPDPPSCSIKAFHDTSLEFSVQFWIAGLDEGATQFSAAINLMIWETLTKAGIVFGSALAKDPPARKNARDNGHPA